MPKKAKIQGSYYPFTQETADILRKAKLTAAEWRVWSYLVGIDPWGERYIDFEVLDVMSVCSVSAATFYRAIAKLKELQLFDFQDKGFTLKNENGISKMRINSQNCESNSQNCESNSQNCESNSQNCENQTPETPLHKASGSPQIFQIDQTKQTLSDRSAGLNQCSTPAVAEEIDEQLTDESTSKSAREREKKNEYFIYYGEEKSQPKTADKSVSSDSEVSQRGIATNSVEHSPEIESKTARSNPKTENESRSTQSQKGFGKANPKKSSSKKQRYSSSGNSSSEKKEVPSARSTNETIKNYTEYQNTSDTPKLDKKLAEVGFPMEDRELFLTIAQKFASEMPDKVALFDCWVVSDKIFPQVMKRYLNREQQQVSEQIAMERRAAAMFREQMRLKKEGKL